LTEVVVAGPQERFQDFLKLEKYRKRISQMAIAGSTSFIVDFEDLLTTDSALAKSLLKEPDEYLGHANRAALAQLQIEDPEYAEEVETVNVRLRGLPETTQLRILGSKHIGKLVTVAGIIVRATPVRPLVMQAAFRCKRCGTSTYVNQTGTFLRAPPVCSDPACDRRGPFDFLQEESTFIDSQEIRIQERPEDLPPGQLPRWLDVKLFGRDLVDVVRPGDNISVVGIVRASAPTLPKVGTLRLFTLHIDTNFIDALSKEPEKVLISPEEEKQILELSKDPWIHRNIIRSIAPSIYGYEHIKEAIMYLLFGGVKKLLPDISIRGEMNALLVGDPGTAKSQLLQYVARVAPRGLYTSGRGSTAAGLTAAVLRERRQGGMTLEAGALVLADKGIACIDEIDKMRPEDRVAIHEAMEQHTVSVAKGGIVATLNARTAILAAANPALGRYDPYQTVANNISLPVTILSRFDLIFVLKDAPEKELDTKMSEHILNLHKTGSAPVEPPVAPDLLRKYVSYAKGTKPILSKEALERLKDFYLTMRLASETEGTPIAITPRQLESLIRIAEARARVAFRKEILAEDAEASIAIMKRSLEEVGIDISSHQLDIDIIMTGKPKSLRDRLQVILRTMIDMEKETGMVERSSLMEKLQTQHEIPSPEAERLIGQLLKEGTIYSPKTGYLKKT